MSGLLDEPPLLRVRVLFSGVGVPACDLHSSTSGGSVGRWGGSVGIRIKSRWMLNSSCAVKRSRSGDTCLPCSSETFALSAASCASRADSRFREDTRLSRASPSSWRMSVCCRLLATHCQATSSSQNAAKYISGSDPPDACRSLCCDARQGTARYRRSTMSDDGGLGGGATLLLGPVMNHGVVCSSQM